MHIYNNIILVFLGSKIGLITLLTQLVFKNKIVEDSHEM